MGKGGYHGGSSIVGFAGAGWFGRGSPTMQPSDRKQSSKRKSSTANKGAAKKQPRHKPTKEEREAERLLKEKAKAAMASVVVEVRREGRTILRRVGLPTLDVK